MKLVYLFMFTCGTQALFEESVPIEDLPPFEGLISTTTTPIDKEATTTTTTTSTTMSNNQKLNQLAQQSQVNTIVQSTFTGISGLSQTAAAINQQRTATQLEIARIKGGKTESGDKNQATTSDENEQKKGQENKVDANGQKKNGNDDGTNKNAQNDKTKNDGIENIKKDATKKNEGKTLSSASSRPATGKYGFTLESAGLNSALKKKLFPGWSDYKIERLVFV